MIIQPRADDHPAIRLGEVFLEDFLDGLVLRGFPPRADIEHFLDATDLDPSRVEQWHTDF